MQLFSTYRIFIMSKQINLVSDSSALTINLLDLIFCDIIKELNRKFWKPIQN